MINKIKKLLKKDNRFQSFIKDSKKNGFAKIIMTSMEKWNYDDHPSKYNGESDCEGKTWEDIDVEYTYKLWKPKDIIGYIKNLIIYKDFTLKTRKWLFTLTSFEVMKWDLAEERAYDISNFDKIEFRFEKITDPSYYGYYKLCEYTDKEKQISKKYRNEREIQFKKITYDELIKSISKDYYKLTHGIWISKEDPTCMVVDNYRSFRFDLKDGWSNNQIGSIIRNYLFTLGYKYDIVIK